ncbi:MAG: hydroxylamine reductase [Alphaproteobacteria bacterium CG_4_10_14_0_2_um_filter_63_37]|nr:MAG: hydroxylamine reductase [Proteobacteria bacterium CG1_02_64_396]PJA24790.1 MAG: hydroxylamine reductase [Alphaproteobacteria bacterium CG_4_10_14_0_2_um_filter_63_37]
MYCNQCEQTSKGVACTESTPAPCGKNPTVAALQDMLVYGLKGIAQYATRARTLGARDAEIDSFALEALFLTITNVNFDEEANARFVYRAAELRDRARAMYQAACERAGQAAETLSGPAAWSPASDIAGLAEQHETLANLKARRDAIGVDLAGLEEMALFGLKGMAAYARHAEELGLKDEEVYAFTHQVLDFLTRDNGLDDLVGMNLEIGRVNFKVLGMLDAANTGAYGDPVPTEVSTSARAGKAILVSGHDLKMLEELLKQTEGTGVNVYTHCEMLPAHSYPGLKKYSHLVGNFGGAWHAQQKEFAQWPGAILMTTNCIIEPKDSYKDRFFTAGPVGWPGLQHVENNDFSPLIAAAQAAPGFSEDEAEGNKLLCGFGHNTVMSVAGTVIEAVKAGALKHFFLIGGCDGAKKDREYFTDLATSAPKDSVVLTLGCKKFRFNDKQAEFGDIGGIPRLLDMGQCNDAYSAILVASELAKAFETDVNSLPLSLVIGWIEQKAVCILQTLLYLGIKNIRLGPGLPAFVSPAVLNVLVEKFNITPLGDAQNDLQAMLAS